MTRTTRYYGFDTETSLFDKERSPDLFQWAVVGLGDEFYNGSTAVEFRDLVQEFYDNLRCDIVIVAHNLTFDYYMTMLFEKLRLQPNANYKIRTIQKPSLAYFTKKVDWWETEDGTPVYFKRDFHLYPGQKMKRKQTVFRINFTDLSNYFLGFPRLESIAKSFSLPGKFNPESMYTFNFLHFGFEAMQFDPDDYLRAYLDMWEYCYQDANIARQVMKIIMTDNPVPVEFRFTVNSFGFSILKKISGWRTFKRPQFWKEKERKALFGGRSGFNPAYVRREVVGYSYDVHSMYPAMLKAMKCPVGTVGKLSLQAGDYHENEQYSLLKEIYESEDQTALVTISVRLNAPVLPYKVQTELGERLFFDHIDQHGRRVEITGVWAIEELFPALRDHEAEIIKMTQVLIYEAKKGLFDDFVDFYYDQKSNSPKNSPAYSKAKLVLNGAGYGKFVEKRRIDIRASQALDLSEEEVENLIDAHFRDKGVPESNRFGKIEIPISAKEYIEIEVQGQDYFVQQVLDQEAIGACSIVGVIITAMGRRLLWEEGMRGNDCIRWDTDGVTISHLLDDSYLHPSQLGKWDLERCTPDSESCVYITYGRKDYRCQHYIKMKGVPKIDITGKEVLTMETHGNKRWDYTAVTKPAEALKRNMKPFSLKDAHKTRNY